MVTMLLINSKKIAGYLDEIGWNYKNVSHNSVLTGYQVPIPFYYYSLMIEVKTTANWVYIRAVLQRDVALARRPSIMHFINSWNESSHLVRFMLTSGCVIIQAELGAAQCHLEAFAEKLAAICRFSALVGAELAVLATNPSANELYAAVAQSWERDPLQVGGGGSVDSDLQLDFDITVNRLPE
jgi:hypothetical protein